jgi:SAM-dependent methyltransferase
MTLLDTERDTYEQIWSNDDYAKHSPGEKYVDVFLDMSGASGGRILDAGTGSGKGALALAARGFDVELCDLTPDGLVDEARSLPFYTACLWHDDLRPNNIDWVYCCDVLEHVPPHFTMLVIQRLLDVARQGVFLSIALVPDRFGALVGHPLHKTVQSFTDWREQLRELGRVSECRDLGDTGLYLVEPR